MSSKGKRSEATPFTTYIGLTLEDLRAPEGYHFRATVLPDSAAPTIEEFAAELAEIVGDEGRVGRVISIPRE